MGDVDIDCDPNCDCDCGDCCSGDDDCECCSCCLCLDPHSKSVRDDTTWNFCIIFGNGRNNKNRSDDTCWCCCCCDDSSTRQTRTNPFSLVGDDKNKPKVDKDKSKETDNVGPNPIMKSNLCSNCGVQLPKNKYQHQYFPNSMCPRCQEFPGSRPTFVPPRSQRFETLDREKYLGRGKDSSFYVYK